MSWLGRTRDGFRRATPRQMAGWCLLASPFVVLLAYVVIALGPWSALGVMAGSGALVTAVVVGAELAMGGDWPWASAARKRATQSEGPRGYL